MKILQFLTNWTPLINLVKENIKWLHALMMVWCLNLTLYETKLWRSQLTSPRRRFLSNLLQLPLVKESLRKNTIKKSKKDLKKTFQGAVRKQSKQLGQISSKSVYYEKGRYGQYAFWSPTLQEISITKLIRGTRSETLLPSVYLKV